MMRIIKAITIYGFLNGKKDIMWNQHGVNIILGPTGSGKTELLRFIYGVISAYLDGSNHYIPRVPITGNGEIRFFNGVLRWNHETGEVTAAGDIPHITICMYSPTEIFDLDEIYLKINYLLTRSDFLGDYWKYKYLLDELVPAEGIGSSLTQSCGKYTCRIGNKLFEISDLPLNWVLVMYMCLKLPTKTDVGHIYILDMPEYGLCRMLYSNYVQLLQVMENFNTDTQFFLATAMPSALHCNSDYYNADKIYEI